MNITTRELTIGALFVTLLSISSFLSIPIGSTYFTLQTLIVLTLGAVLYDKLGALCILTYILLGIFGIPVFAGFRSGLGVVIGPTGGFIIGFLFSVIVTGNLTKIYEKRYQKSNPIFLFITSLTGLFIIYIFGVFQFMIVLKTNFLNALLLSVAPFVLLDLVKISLSVVLIKYLKRFTFLSTEVLKVYK